MFIDLMLFVFLIPKNLQLITYWVCNFWEEDWECYPKLQSRLLELCGACDAMSEEAEQFISMLWDSQGSMEDATPEQIARYGCIVFGGKTMLITIKIYYICLCRYCHLTPDLCRMKIGNAASRSHSSVVIVEKSRVDVEVRVVSQKWWYIYIVRPWHVNLLTEGIASFRWPI